MGDVRDLMIDTTTGDLVLTTGLSQDLATVSDAEALAQDAQMRLRTIRGEWFLDPTVGLPYWTDVFVKAPNLARIKADITAELLATPGITAVLTVSLSLDPKTRKLTGIFTAQGDLGKITGTIGSPQ